jgi:tyrosinase
MRYTRKNVYANGGDFTDPTIYWYARGVAAMKERELADPTSWRFFAAIHGIDEPLWRHYRYLRSSDKRPVQAQIDLYWNQCQHGTWYFLPWHRGYLLALEATIRYAVISLGGPSDWAIPYWNYFAPDEFRLPPAFASPDWPDGKGNNPLYVRERWGPHGDSNVFVPPKRISLRALAAREFTGVTTGGDAGFGGVDVGFQWRGHIHGRLESQPHDIVHIMVGGPNPHSRKIGGLMSFPPTAGLDPIFYLHHANIDRLWEVWLKERASHANPTDPGWVNGPASIGERAFVMPWPPTGKEWYYTPGDMADLAKLDYVYEDGPDDLTAAHAEPLERLRRAAGETEGAAAMATTGRNVELVGATLQPLRIIGREGVRAPVRLDEQARRKVTANFAAAAAEEGTPAAVSERVFLNLENVTGVLDATALDVYVNLPEGADPDDHPDRHAGTVGLFGVRQATDANREHGGAGLTFVLEITDIVQALHLENALDADALEVRIVPFDEVPEEAKIRIGRVSLFRQGR